jgi:alkylation response protein AidB-like acyl-CoA dehydrogenase
MIAHDTPTDAELGARFAPVFDRLRLSAAQRERERAHPFPEVRELQALGFGALRLPRERGGLGASLRQLFALLTELAAADSNITQALRQHFFRVEMLLLRPDDPDHRRWLDRVAAGDLFGNGTTEPHGLKLGQIATRVRRAGAGYRLDGKKIYCTGNLYARWVPLVALDEDGQQVLVVVPSDAPGVVIRDDWDGFGQRLTGTDTTEFQNVFVPAGDVTPIGAFEGHHGAGFHQLVLVATLAGIGRAVRDDLVREVRGRTRIYFTGTGELPRYDPIVAEAVGSIAATVEACDALATQAAATLHEAWAVWTSGADFATVDAAFVHAETIIGMAQIVLSREIVDVAGRLFDPLGASSTLRTNGLDRHWRNARTVATHNSALFKARVVGDYLLNGTPPRIFRAGHDVGEKPTPYHRDDTPTEQRNTRPRDTI